MARRRTKFEDQAVGVIAVVGGVVWVLSQIWIYLVIVGAITVVVALGWYAIRHLSTTEARSPVLVGPAPPPENPYRQLVNVSPAAFDDKTAMEAAGVEVFSAWVRTLPRGPRKANEFVRRVNLRRRTIGRLETQCVGRHATWSAKPYGGRKPVTGPPIHPESIDPWTVDPEKLRNDSRHYAACDTCRSEGRVACQSCSATGRIACGACDGYGKVEGTTAAGHVRQLNCKGCRGRGDVNCSHCHRGRLKCPECHGKKKLDRWLEITEELRVDTQVEPDGPILKAFPWGMDGVLAADEAIEQDGRVLARFERDGSIDPSELAGHLPGGWLESHWNEIAAQLLPGERVAKQRFTLLDVPALEITYSLDDQQAQVVEFEGLRLLAPPPSAETLFHRRSKQLRWIGLGLATVPTGVAISYLARGSYFHSSLVLGVVACLCVGAIATHVFFSAATLGHRRARPWLAVVAAALVGASTVAVFAEPSLSDAKAYVEQGNFDAARSELAALGDPSSPELKPLWARIHMTEVLGASSVRSARGYAAELSVDSDAYKLATAHIDGLLLQDARAALSRRDFTRAESLIGETSTSFRDVPEVQTLLTEAAHGKWSECNANRSWDCAFARAGALSKLDEEQGKDAQEQTLAGIASAAGEAEASLKDTKDLPTRISAAQSVLSLWSLWSNRGGGESPKRLARIQKRLERDLKSQARVEARAARRAERERRAEERRQAREARKRERAERRARRANAPLRCCDGSFSPSCTCGGSRRGCCSHHGGVCGCSE